MTDERAKQQAEFDAKNEGVNKGQLTSQLDGRLRFVREWIKPWEVGYFLGLNSGRLPLVAESLGQMAVRIREKIACPKEAEEVIVVLYLEVIELVLRLYGLAEARCAADADRLASAHDVNH